jgi:Recombination endonuclease VII
MAEVYGCCRQCGAEGVEYRKNGNNVQKVCQSCKNEDNRRRMQLVRWRRSNGEGLPVGKPCACCQAPMQRPMLDHDHRTGVIRGWLCHNDNLLLGVYRDDPVEFLELAARATDRARALTGRRREEELNKAIRHLNRAAYLLRHCS